MGIQDMMKQAQEMQERLQREMSELSVQATSGGGMVTVTVNGHKHLQKIAIDPEVVSKDDVGMLQDLIVAAVKIGRASCGKECRSVCRSRWSPYH